MLKAGPLCRINCQELQVIFRLMFPLAHDQQPNTFCSQPKQKKGLKEGLFKAFLAGRGRGRVFNWLQVNHTHWAIRTAVRILSMLKHSTLLWLWPGSVYIYLYISIYQTFSCTSTSTGHDALLNNDIIKVQVGLLT